MDALFPKPKDGQPCLQCYLSPGIFLCLTGGYVQYCAYKGTDIISKKPVQSKAWMYFVGSLLVGGGIYFGIITPFVLKKHKLFPEKESES